MKLFSLSSILILIICVLCDASEIELAREPWFKNRSTSTTEQTPHKLKLPTDEATPQDSHETSPPVEPTPDTLLIPELKGFFLTINPDEEKTGAEGIVFGELNAAFSRDALETLLKPRLKQPIHLSALTEIEAEIQTLYAQSGFLLGNVITPAQPLEDSTLKVILLTGQVESVEANSEPLPPRLSRLMTYSHGDPLMQRSQMQSLRNLNWNPYRTTEVIFRKGTQPGRVLVDYQVQEPSRPFEVYTGFENSGTDTTQDERLYAGLTLWRLPTHEGIVNLEYRAAPEIKLSETFSATASAPLVTIPATVDVFAAYSRSEPDIPIITLQGEFKQMGARLLREWEQAEESPNTHRTSLGFDWKESNSDFQFGTFNLFTKHQVIQFTLQHSISRSDRMGQTHLRGGITWSPGNLSSLNSDPAFTQTRQGLESTYYYLTFSLLRQTPLTEHFQWDISLEGQYSEQPLVASERLGLGGLNSIRGYAEFTATVDRGIILRQILRKSPIPLTIPKLNTDTTLSPYVFWDYGTGTELPSPLISKEHHDLSSVGIGMDIELGTHTRAYFSWAKQLRSDASNPQQSSQKSHFGIKVRY